MVLQQSSATGYSLPVWVTAVALAALRCLRGQPFSAEVPVVLPNHRGPERLPVQQAARLGDGVALAIGRCRPGDHLDLTRNLPIWVQAQWGAADQDPAVVLRPGEGVGVHASSGELCASAFATNLLHDNLAPLLQAGETLQLQLVFPTGERLAQRTSNAAFGVVDGLALIGTCAEVQPSAAPDQLDAARLRLQAVAAARPRQPVVLVLGENGRDLALRCGLPEAALVKVGNWVGPLLVAAAEQGCRQVLLWGYHGKLLKLAGGIFHTHHHLADGRAAVVTAFAALEGLTGDALVRLHGANTVEEGLNALRADDPALSARLEQRLWLEIEQQAQAYVARHSEQPVQIGAALFDRSRVLRGSGSMGQPLLQKLGYRPQQVPQHPETGAPQCG